MKFYDTTNKHDSLAHYVWWLLGIGNTTTADYPLVDMARATNTAKFNLALKIWRKSDDWDFDDTANNDYPIATSSFVNGQQDYSLPTDALEIRRVEVKDINGNWSKLSKIDESDISDALDEYESTDGIPEKYRLTSGQIVFYPAPDTTQVTASNGFKIYYNRKVDEFNASTTTTEIGFGESGDQVIAYEVAEEWAIIYDNTRIPSLQQKRLELESNFLNHISGRSKPENKLKVNFETSE